MAEDIGSLYVRLGLDITELETGFATADRTVDENIRRLNRESTLVRLLRLRSQVEITGLDEAADAERILQIRQESLNQQMAIQRDRVRILTAELQNLTQAHGAEAAITQRTAISLERSRLILAQLERELNGLNDTSEESTSIFDELSGMLPSMPTKLQAIGIAAGAVASGFGAAGLAVNELLEDFRELQKQSYELNLPVNGTKQLLRELKLAGGDIGDYEGYIRGITDAFVKGEYDDPEFIALRRYGAEITDATGRLKNFAEISDELFKAWEKAKAEGNEIEFLQLTGGESGIRDAIQLFERLKEAKEDAAKIYDANIDAEQLHELDRILNLLDEQSKELKNALGNLFVPAAQAAAEKFFNVLHDGTAWLVENKNAIQRWGFIAEEVFSTIAEKVKKGYSAVGEYVSEATKPKTTGDERVDKMLGNMSWRYGSPQTPYGVDKMVSGMTEASKSYGVFNEAVARAEDKQRQFNGELGETTKSWADFRREVEETDNKLKEGEGNPLSQYGWQRVQQFRTELEDLRAELDNWDNDYETALAQLNLWLDRELTQKNYVSTAERVAIEELYAAKLKQIDRERADKLQEIREQIASADNTALENKLAAIEKEKEAWISAGMEEAEATQLAEQQKTSYIAGVEAELTRQIQSLHQTALQQRIAQIEQEKQAWIDKGASEVQAEQLAQAQIRQAHEETEKKLNEIRESVASLDRSELENKLSAIEKEKNAWIELGMTKAEAEELAQKKIQHVMQETAEKAQAEAKKNLEERAKAHEDYLQKIQAAEEEAARKNAAARNEAWNVLKSEGDQFATFLNGGAEALKKKLFEDLVKSGVNPELMGAMTADKLEAYKTAKDDVMKALLPNWSDPYSAEPVKKSAATVQKSFDEVSQAAGNVANSLNNLADSVAEGGSDYKMRVGDVVAYEQPDGSTLITNAPSETPATIPQEMSTDISQTVQGVIEALSELPATIQNVIEQVTGMMTPEEMTPPEELAMPDFSGIEETISNLATSIEETFSSVAENFTGTGNSFGEVTVQLSDLGAAIRDLITVQSQAQTQPQPVEVNTTVDIQEAHAWDYDHIEELANRVAQVLMPVVISAIGGDSNSY